jgi:hypothetical protein
LALFFNSQAIFADQASSLPGNDMIVDHFDHAPGGGHPYGGGVAGNDQPWDGE